MPDATVVTKSLSKDFGHFTAVDNLNLNVGQGEIFGFLGPNGAGKTTTVRMLCTLIEPTRGSAIVSGYDIREQPAEVRRRIGVVSEGVSLYKDLTIKENLKLLSTLYDLPTNQAQKKITELLDMFAFNEKSDRLVSALSSGWQKKALVCAALLHDPKVLFLDEVTSGLDPQTAIAIQDFTRKLCEDRDVTVIWTTHYMSEPDKICDRIGIIFAGRLVKIGTPSELKRSVNELYAVEVETPGLTPAQIQEIRKIIDAHKVMYNDPLLRVAGEHDGDLVQEVASTLLSVGAKIKSINTVEPTLEEAFISLTGGEEEIDRFLEKSTQKT